MPQYYFEVDNRVIRVYPSHVREYEIGEKFTHYLYVSEEREIADSNNYSIIKGISGAVLVAFICYANFCAER